MEKTHVEISKDTRRRLRVWKAKRDMTYDEAISELLEQTMTPIEIETPRMKARLQSDQTIAAATHTQVAAESDAEWFDNEQHSAKVPEDGIYGFRGTAVVLDTKAGDTLMLDVRKDGKPIHRHQMIAEGGDLTVKLNGLGEFDEGDTIQLWFMNEDTQVDLSPERLIEVGPDTERHERTELIVGPPGVAMADYTVQSKP